MVLDFSHLREGISRFLRGQASFKVQSVISDIMTQPKPRIVSIDAKKDVENQLKTVCESFILNVTRSALDPLMSFLKKVCYNNCTTTVLFNNKFIIIKLII